MHINNYTDNNMIILLNFLNKYSKIKDGTLSGTTFLDEALKRNIRLDSSCLERKCSLTVEDINFIHNNKVSQYIVLPYTVINRELKYKIGNFVFYSFKKLYSRYNKYLDIYDIACSSNNLNQGYMIFLCCEKGSNKFFFRTETVQKTAEYNNKEDIKLYFSNIHYFQYSHAIVKIQQKKI